MTATQDIDAAFDGILLAENTSQEEGYTVGVRQGKLGGYIDGYKAGQQQGAKLGVEIGFYRGFAKSWTALLPSEAEDGRKMRALRGLLLAVDQVPHDPTDPSLHDCVTSVRSKFKQVCAVLGIKSSFGDEKESLSF